MLLRGRTMGSALVTGALAVVALLGAAGPAGAATSAVSSVATSAGTSVATSAATPSGTPSPRLCPDPGLPPTGVTASATLVPPNSVQVRLTWTPLTMPAGCSPGTTEIEQVTPPGPVLRVPNADGETTIDGLATLTAYTWRVRFVAGTVTQWTTVSTAPVLPLDYCMALPSPRTITGTAESPTAVHLEWGALNYPSACGGTVTVTNETTGAAVATVAPSRTGVTISGLTPGSTNTWLVSFLIELGRVTVTQPALPAATCTAVARVDSSWGGGLTATVTVTNTGTQPIAGWESRWTLPGGTRVTAVWNATAGLVAGVLTVSGTGWNSALAAGASTTFGLVANGSGTLDTPVLTCTARPA